MASFRNNHRRGRFGAHSSQHCALFVNTPAAENDKVHVKVLN